MHELSRLELQIAGLVATDAVVDVLLGERVDQIGGGFTDAEAGADRLVGSADDEKIPPALKSTKTAEAAVPTDEVVAVAPAPK
jgi:hypothetical protein